MKEVRATIVDRWERPGDYNKDVKVFGIKTKSGHSFETCGNFGGFTEYPNPIQDVIDIELNKEYTIVYGRAVSYSLPTLIGIKS